MKLYRNLITIKFNRFLKYVTLVAYNQVKILLFLNLNYLIIAESIKLR